ncbi:hypothetical protein [Methanogenium cariaci]|uniref:hypothetical protein n=1 Tax=Methanogenium cariaci TaxID=2197 RepID=UPI0007851094|nr:hypothetical protein [Methanogenium cariaci]
MRETPPGITYPVTAPPLVPVRLPNQPGITPFTDTRPLLFGVIHRRSFATNITVSNRDCRPVKGRMIQYVG